MGGIRRASAGAGSLGAAGLALLAMTVVACGGGESAIPGETPAGTPATAPGSASPTATAVGITETDYKIALGRTSFPAGTYAFVVKNDGQTPHALHIEGSGIEAETPTILPGGSATLTVTLGVGEYELDCPVDGHEELGMAQKITVT
ncbi:hypothetical protein I6A84_26265 [Frankia sp. CNm7]|uniref:EfeO-type cupredoxin-like domain-containing protein n=1 Tax=Frankia nepalensis TaxID=1836974 RepID=A0A937RSZ5_9ACTN|nr:hypothetical protein [Frankia nepalensis]MBL7501006.1 hypothetical protein [Frankia nepalensis]MBL7512481.1 hypothetical protein [Frankia nepalensis]MBL7521492.1 hypothetical protein [Frankia nepalensis]MBL7632784.1 hypothetical protein [Frankia nepalensis]